MRAKETITKMLEVLGSLDREVPLFNFASGISMAAGLILQEGFSVQPLIPFLTLPSVLLQEFSSIHIPLFLFPAYLLNASMQEEWLCFGGAAVEVE